MKHLRLGALLLPVFLNGCTSTLSQINPGYRPILNTYLLPAIIERVEYVPTGTTRKIPLKECIGNDCRTIHIMDASEVMVVYYLKTDHYDQRLIYEKLSLTATANTTKTNQRVILSVAQYEDGSLEITGMEALR